MRVCSLWTETGMEEGEGDQQKKGDDSLDGEGMRRPKVLPSVAFAAAADAAAAVAVPSVLRSVNSF